VSGNYIKVKQGDCVESIAAKNGFFWKTLWDDSHNSELKNKRNNPNMLQAGDKLYIPEKKVTTVDGSTETRNRFKRKGVPHVAYIKLMRGNKPRDSIQCECTINNKVVNSEYEGNGVFRLSVPIGAKTGTLKIVDGDITEIRKINFGYMDPVGEVTGIQKRLINMGYECRKTGVLDQETKEVLGQFQKDYSLPNTKELDSDTISKFKDLDKKSS
jgi:hypothetical protein